MLVLSTGAFFAVTDPSPDGESRAAVLLLWSGAYLVAGVVLADGLLRRRLRVRVPAALVAFIALAALSVLWSVAPQVTVRRSVALIGTVVVGLVLAQRLPPVGVLDALRRAMLVVAVASLLLLLSGDPRALDTTHDTLRGVVASKNTLGQAMGIGLLAAATTAFLQPHRLTRCALSAVPMVAALVLTGSAGGAVIAVLVLVLMTAAVLWRANGGRVLLASAAALAMGLLVFALPRATPEDVAGLVGRDPTITGRTEIWDQAMDAVAQRPLVGHGYGAFWHPSGAEAAARISARLFWSVPHAHNGLLDVALGIGIIGAVLALAVVGGLLVRGVRDARAGRRQSAVLRTSIALLLIASNLVESNFLRENHILSVLLVAALATREPFDRMLPPRPRPGVGRRVEGAGP